MITGPRQSGKTTLVQQYVSADRRYVTLDDETRLAGARADPTGFVRDLDRAVIDEVQRAPDLLRAIKRSVDSDRRPGRFLLTGSANVLTLTQVSESLAGRLEVISLLPLAQAEIRRKEPSFLRQAFKGKIAAPTQALIGAQLVETVLIGGYPEMLARPDPDRRQAWASQYVSSIVQSDVREIADIEKLDSMSRLLPALAHRSGQLLNLAQLAGQIGIDAKTAGKYVAILEQLFLLRRVEPWSRNPLKRLIKTAKLHFLDSGLLAAMLGASTKRLSGQRSGFGPLLEAFAFSELSKQIEWYPVPCGLYYYRDKDQDEVDLVVESNAGEVVGIEIKAAATVTGADLKGLRKLAAACGDDFKLGVVFYDGEALVPFGKGLVAAPVASLWG
jgi:predicted AAA+ superfamily ATPase